MWRPPGSSLTDTHLPYTTLFRFRRGPFLETSARCGTAVQNVEKDFWVCWTLDVLFNGLPPDGPRLLFKGGTSLSKAYSLIFRFSEDIDITVFREDIGEPAETAELDALSGKQRRIRLDRIRTACQRSEARRVGQACVRTCRSRWSMSHETKNETTRIKAH